MKSILLNGESLTLAQVEEIALARSVPRLAAVSRRAMHASRRFVLERLRRGERLYGINTGFGKLSDRSIPAADTAALQINLIRSHACAVGEPLPIPDVRAAMLIRANTLAKGFSGIRPEVAELIVGMLRAGVHPVIPRQGSVGASGDLAPSAHLGLVMIGEGEAWWRDRRMKGREALRRAALEPLRLEAKEGLSILNGTHFLCGVGTLAWQRAMRCLVAADVAGALSLEPLMGTSVAFDPRIQAIRRHRGQAEAADHLRRLTAGSGIIASHRGCGRVQDAYSLRCMPQIHGAARDTLRHAGEVLETEINSATDNPLVFIEPGEILSGGNFHGAPVASVLDFCAISLAQLGTVSERRIERLVNPELSGLPPFLTPDAGLESGLMVPQIIAAALASENKVLSHPASVDTIPTSADKEDHVSMGMHAALKFSAVADNLEHILAIEMICACQAIDLLDLPGHPRQGKGTAKAFRWIRQRVPRLDEDRPLTEDIRAVREMIRAGAFADLV